MLTACSLQASRCLLGGVGSWHPAGEAIPLYLSSLQTLFRDFDYIQKRPKFQNFAQYRPTSWFLTTMFHDGWAQRHFGGLTPKPMAGDASGCNTTSQTRFWLVKSIVEPQSIHVVYPLNSPQRVQQYADWTVTRAATFKTRQILERYTPCQSQKNCANLFLSELRQISTNFVIIFDRMTAKRLKLCEMHSFLTSSNSRHHTTLLNWDTVYKITHHCCSFFWFNGYFRLHKKRKSLPSET